MNTKKILLSALLGCLFVSARADDGAGRQVGLLSAMAGADAGLASSGLIADPLRGKLVKNAPYSAEAIQENQRKLADGNQITTKTSTLNYRDSHGNTRQEIRSPSGEVQSVTINTAADNVHYSVIPAAKLVIKMSLDKIGAKAAAVGAAAGKAIKARMEAQRKEGKPANAEHKDGAEIVVKRAAPNTNINPNMVPLIAGAMGDAKWSSKATTKDLGVKEIEGVKAEGKLRSYEIPAGEVGNRNPIVVTNENWYSPELQVTLYSKHSDARSGDVVYRLANLKRGEQAAALFGVPSDYTVKDITEGALQGW